MNTKTDTETKGSSKISDRITTFSTDALKKVLRFAFSVHVAYEKSMKDGILNWKDLPNAFDPGTKLIPAIGAAPSALKQALNISKEQKAELKDWIQTTYDIKDDVLEEKVERGLSIVIELAHFVGAIIPEKK